MRVVNAWHNFEGCLLSVHFIQSEDLMSEDERLSLVEDEASVAHHVWGTAVMIAPGVALTAKHIVDEAMEQFGSLSTMICCGFTAQGAGIVWNVHQITMSDDSDVAILTLSLSSSIPDNQTFISATITTNVPSSDELVHMVGFRAAKNRFETMNLETKVAMMAIVSTGPAEDYFPEGRDSVMLPWPSVQVGCGLVGGMSGGPAFDAAGNVFGVICSSLSSDDGQGPSYVSLISPALTYEISPIWPAGIYSGATRIVDIDKRICNIIGRN